MKVIEDDNVVQYLKERGLVEQYQKAKHFITIGLFHSVCLKKRKPRSAGIWSFRVTKKYRALCKRKGSMLVVFRLDDHQ